MENIRKIIREVVDKFFDSHEQEMIPYLDREYYHGIYGTRLDLYLKTGKIPESQQEFGGIFSITDDFNLAKMYCGGNGIVLRLKIKPNTDVEIGDPFDEDFIPEGDLSDIGESEFLVNNDDIFLSIENVFDCKSNT